MQLHIKEFEEFFQLTLITDNGTTTAMNYLSTHNAVKS